MITLSGGEFGGEYFDATLLEIGANLWLIVQRIEKYLMNRVSTLERFHND